VQVPPRIHPVAARHHIIMSARGTVPGCASLLQKGVITEAPADGRQRATPGPWIA